ncbi:MAG TPA: sialidase family protein [Streptosporangiaceae bacterium]|nr:sialidase family protein [Streptosporangiaceae bacterium]
MPDEIDLLRWFLEDTPEPDDAAWNRARTALAEARAEDPGAQGALGRRHRIRWRPPGRRVIVATAVAAIAAAAAAALITVVTQGPPPTLAGRLTTGWQSARPLPGGAHPAHAPSGTWRLMSYLVARGWQEDTTGPEPGWLTCPTAATCYVEGDNATSPSGPANMNSFYVSTDGAQTWSVLPVPGGVTFTSALSCASATYCAAGGLYYGHQPVYLTTASGGHSWTVNPLPARVGQIVNLDCVTATTCRGLASASGKPISIGFDLMSDMHFVTTSDGGRRFTVVPFPKDELIESLTCPTAAHCVAVGFRGHIDPRNGPDLDHGVLLTSDDGGLTWQQRAWPAGYGPGPYPDVTCADASHCAMIGFIERNGTIGDQYGYTSGKDAIQYTVIAFSSDGGATWTASTLPHTIPYPMMSALTCPTTRTCYAAGSDLIAQRIGSTYNEGSSVVAITHDAGRTWQRVTFAVPAKVPGGMQGDSFMDIGQIQCPQPDACVATGISDQGSTSTPIYTNHG